jgi:predicted CoA-substrate-specific enzyme activase
LGVDLGSANVKATWLAADHADSGTTPHSSWVATQGKPLEALAGLLETMAREQDLDQPFLLSATGIAQDLVTQSLPTGGVNEVVAVGQAVAQSCPATRTVIDVGGQFTKWILLNSRGVEDFAINGLCAAGSGAFLEQQAARLKVSIGELGQLASSAVRGATVAGRCSVFAKSDMIHLQQKGTPIEEIAYGVCVALVRTFVATVLAGRKVEPPLVLVGGGAANPGLRRAFQEVLQLTPEEVTVPPNYLTLGSWGATLVGQAGTPLNLDEVLSRLRNEGTTASPKQDRSVPLDLPALEPFAPVRQIPEEDPPLAELGPDERHRVFIGIDVGSVSTNLVVLDESHQVLQGVYLATRGRPMEVLDEGLQRIQAKFGNCLEVLAVGATGSGRHLAATALGADTIKNEITAQMASAASYFPDVEGIIEIGGQDSKFIGAHQGRLAAFEMNKICAAGTGSFLEEQAERLGVRIRGEFSELARRAEQPHDLGSRCTVFMDTELVRALQLGVSHEDICAGLAYSVARNYLDKVVAGRPLGRRVVFQGGTASNDAVVAAMRALTGATIEVHPYNRISGAIGAALLAARQHRRSPKPSRFRGVEACRDTRTRSFECKRCSNRCQVNRIHVGDRISHFGDTCERFSDKDGAPRHHDRASSRDYFAAREELLQQHLPPRRPDRPLVMLPRGSHLLEMAPFWAAVLHDLGYDVALGEATSTAVAAAGSTGLPGEFCYPIKVMAGQIRHLLREEPEAMVLAPSVLELPDPAGDRKTHTCLFSQELPNLLARQESRRLLVPQGSTSQSQGGLRETIAELCRLLSVPPRRARCAVARGLEAQQAFDRARHELGREALKETNHRAIVVLGRPYNLYDPLVNLGLARHLARLPVAALPMDLLPVEHLALAPEHKRLLWRYSRDQLRTLTFLQEHAELYPLWVSSFGCGLDAFAVKHFRPYLAERPALLLEFDEHRGEAGLVTRLEAFVDEIDEATPQAPSGSSRHRRPSSSLSGRVVVPHTSEHAFVAAAALRSRGWDARVLPYPDETTVRLGEQVSSGGECHPWSVLAGELVRWRTSGEARRGDIFYYPQGSNPCLIHQYGDGHRHLLARLGLDDNNLVWALDGPNMLRQFGGHVGQRVYEGFAAVDILISAACLRRPYEQTPGSVNAVHQANLDRLCQALAQGKDPEDALQAGLADLLHLPVEPQPQRPIVGVCGDLYTRISRRGNADLFARLESMGCQVWAHPFMSGMLDTGIRIMLDRWVERGQLRMALTEFVQMCAAETCGPALRRHVPVEFAPFCLNPPPRDYRELATPYAGPRSNNLIVDILGKTVDFARRGADGVICAVGIGCMLGAAAEGGIREIRSDYTDIPMVTLAYGAAEGPAQRIKLETFVHQVHERARQKPQGGSPWTVRSLCTERGAKSPKKKDECHAS